MVRPLPWKRQPANVPTRPVTRQTSEEENCVPRYPHKILVLNLVQGKMENLSNCIGVVYPGLKHPVRTGRDVSVCGSNDAWMMLDPKGVCSAQQHGGADPDMGLGGARGPGPVGGIVAEGCPTQERRMRSLGLDPKVQKRRFGFRPRDGCKNIEQMGTMPFRCFGRIGLHQPFMRHLRRKAAGTRGNMPWPKRIVEARCHEPLRHEQDQTCHRNCSYSAHKSSMDRRKSPINKAI